MKRIIMCIGILLLTGCQSQETPSKKESLSTTKDANLVLKEWYYMSSNGDGNENGYYFMKNGEDDISRIHYYDYTTRQEIVLCNKPECKHLDESCTAYLTGFGLMNEMFVYQEHLYIIENRGTTMSMSGQREEMGPGIIQMDLDGQNRKELYRTKEGFDFEHGNLAIADDYLYIPLVKNEMVETSNHTTMQVSSKKYLYAISLKTGKETQITDMKYKGIVGVEGRNIIMNSYQFSSDPQTYIDNKDFVKYDQVMMNAKNNYEIFNIDTKESRMIEAQHDEIGYVYENKVYTMEKDGLYALDFTSNAKEKVIDLSEDYTIANILHHTVIVEKWDEQFLGSYAIDLENPQLKELNQYMRAPKEPVHILAKTNDQLLVVYDRDGKEEKTWAGTMQYETTEEFIGLISIDNYLNSEQKYQPIKTLTKKRTM